MNFRHFAASFKTTSKLLVKQSIYRIDSPLHWPHSILFFLPLSFHIFLHFTEPFALSPISPSFQLIRIYFPLNFAVFPCQFLLNSTLSDSVILLFVRDAIRICCLIFFFRCRFFLFVTVVPVHLQSNLSFLLSPNPAASLRTDSPL